MHSYPTAGEVAMDWARRSKFLAEHIGDRSRDSLAQELFGVYLALRAEYPWDDPSLEDQVDPWPMKLHLADVLEKYVLRATRA